VTEPVKNFKKLQAFSKQVILEKNFSESFIYKGENWKIGAYILGGILWVTNKILIDYLFSLNKSIHRHKSKINATIRF
jgi:hypothetical protein